MKTTRLIILFFYLWLGISQAYAEYFRRIGLAEGMSSPSVMAIYQDQLGRMWFGTREGINLYDGGQITVFKGWMRASEQDTASVWLGNEVSAITGDRNGDIYFLIDKILFKYFLRSGRFQPLSSSEISVLTSFDGDIWYIRHDSLFYLRNGSEEAETAFGLQEESVVTCLTVKKNHIYVGTKNGLLVIDRRMPFGQKHLLEGTDIYSVFESSEGELWVGTRMHGLYRTDSRGQLHKVPFLQDSPEGINSEQIRNFVEDDQGNVWFGTFNGLYKWHASARQYRLIQIPHYMGGLSHPSIFSLYKDKQGTLWAGSYFGGVNYFNPQHDDFVHYDYAENVSSDLYYSYIGDIARDKNGNLWIGTDGGGVCCLNRDWEIQKRLTAGPGNSLPHNNIKSLCYDRNDDCLYIGTYLGGLSRYDISTGRFHNYLKETKGGEKMPNDVIFHVEMWKDRLYVSARNGLFCLDTQTQTFQEVPVPPAYYEHFDIDVEGYICLAKWGEILLADLERPDSVTRIPLTIEGHVPAFTQVLCTSQGTYISTLGSGVFFCDRKTRELTRFTAENSQLPSNFCYNLCETPNGNILVTSEKGVTSFKPGGTGFTTIDFMRNFPSAHIINGCGVYASSDGRIYIGDTEGVTAFSENEFERTGGRDSAAHFYFSKLWVNNRSVSPGDADGILSESLPFVKELKLKHYENNLVIRFAHSDYRQQLSEKWYRYKLEGFDPQWVETQQTTLYYTNLDPGEYTLRVAAIERNGSDTPSDEISLQLVIVTPWYATWWAWSAYVMIFIGCVSYFISSRIAKRTLALSLEKERFEKQQIERLNHEKLVFFTNVSHEFRTPLTLIISHIDMLLQRHSLSPVVYNPILKIRKNAQYLSNLISELLEFRKLEQNHETLHLMRQDIVAFLKEIYLSFADYAQKRNITYTFQLPEAEVLCWFDARLMEKVFFNLLSNAFKFTHDGGKICISGTVTDDDVYIRISDTGVGISRQDSSLIFTRFYQGNNQSEKKQDIFKGTGIGLALTKNIIEKHHGNIGVESVLGEGSTFTVRLTRREDVYRGDENVEMSYGKAEPSIIENSQYLPADSSDGAETPAVEEGVTDQSRTVLLVEDNEELLQVLKDLFSPLYKVICAHNGKEGLEQIYAQKPDLVVSDVMMPEMTGTEMCLQVKNNLDFCHIPVILLTALNSPEQNLEGLNRGADDYITKPFHAQLLLARANNLIRNRLLIQHQFHKKPMSEIDLTGINPLDKDLLKRVTEIIEKHIDDTEFDVPVLCKEAAIGRSLLYSKFKALTGMTPNNFILNYRLKYAASMLQKYPDIPIAEVSDRCGFSTPVYFSRCFKNQYGCTPQAYQKEKRKSGPVSEETSCQI